MKYVLTYYTVILKGPDVFGFYQTSVSHCQIVSVKPVEYQVFTDWQLIRWQSFCTYLRVYPENQLCTTQTLDQEVIGSKNTRNSWQLWHLSPTSIGSHGNATTFRYVCLHVDVVYFVGPDIHWDLPVTGINIYWTNNWMHVELFRKVHVQQTRLTSIQLWCTCWPPVNLALIELSMNIIHYFPNTGASGWTNSWWSLRTCSKHHFYHFASLPSKSLQFKRKAGGAEDTFNLQHTSNMHV